MRSVMNRIAAGTAQQLLNSANSVEIGVKNITVSALAKTIENSANMMKNSSR